MATQCLDGELGRGWACGVLGRGRAWWLATWCVRHRQGGWNVTEGNGAGIEA